MKCVVIAIGLFVAGRAEADEAFPVEPIPRIAADAEIEAAGAYVAATGDNFNEMRLDRGELASAIGLGTDAAAEVRIEALRSAADGGALGIDGDTLVARVKHAYLRGGHAIGAIRLFGAAGLAPDPWIAALDADNTTRPLSRSATERLLEMSPADLSLIGGASIGPVRATVAVGNGEGLAYPERNTGKTTTALVEGVPYATALARVRIFGMVRDGSIGTAAVRDHRFGGGATVASTYAAAGFEVVRALGLYGRGELVGTVFGGWVEGRPHSLVAIAARGSTLRLDDGSRTTFGGGVALEPWREGRGHLRIWLAIDRSTSKGTGMPLATDAGDATTAMLIVSAFAPFASKE